MKKLDKFIIKSFLGPLALTFSISMFILLLTFLWRKIETLIGKGLEWSTILELFTYAGAGMVPMALPLSILLASIMTMGNFGEKSELTAMKSAGISLWRIFRPLWILSLIFSFIAFYFAGSVIPQAELRTKQIAADIKDKKPTINIRPQEFYKEISNYVIRVDKKDENKNKLYGVLIYDHSKDMGNVEVIRADSGYMYSSENNQTLIFRLYSGEVFSEDLKDGNYYKRPLTRIQFQTQVMRFDVSNFAFQESEKDKYSDNYKVVNIRRLSYQIDSLKHYNDSTRANYEKYLFSRLSIVDDNKKTNHVKQASGHGFYEDYANLKEEERKNIESYCEMLWTDLCETYRANTLIKEADDEYLVRHYIVYYQKFTLSLACIILFFIGAPLGAIIRKGGLGMPVVVSLIAFALYYTLGLMGESMAKSFTLSPFIAVWMPSFIFFPIGIFLTLKATSDSKVLSAENWHTIFSRLLSLFKKRKKNDIKI